MTTRPFRFAVQGGPLNDPHALAEHARHVESLGYDELFSSDHVSQAVDAAGDDRVDPLVPLVVAALATDRLRVGPLVLNNELHQPALLARTAATVDRMTGGRLVLGLGAGYAADEHVAIGSPIRPPRERVTRFGESLTILRALLDTGAADVDGEFEHVHVDALGVRPTQERIPFLIGGHGRRMVALAGRSADIFQFTGLTHDADGSPSAGGFAMADLRLRAQWLEEAAGDRIDVIERSALVQFTHVGSGAPTGVELAARFGLDVDVIGDTPFVLVGSVERIVDDLHRRRETLGITHYVVRDPDGFAPVVDALAGR